MKRFFEYLKPFSPMVITVMLLVLLQSLAELALPSLMADIVDKGIARGDTALIWRIGGRMLDVYKRQAVESTRESRRFIANVLL